MVGTSRNCSAIGARSSSRVAGNQYAGHADRARATTWDINVPSVASLKMTVRTSCFGDDVVPHVVLCWLTSH